MNGRSQRVIVLVAVALAGAANSAAGEPIVTVKRKIWKSTLPGSMKSQMRPLRRMPTNTR